MRERSAVWSATGLISSTEFPTPHRLPAPIVLCLQRNRQAGLVFVIVSKSVKGRRRTKRVRSPKYSPWIEGSRWAKTASRSTFTHQALTTGADRSWSGCMVAASAADRAIGFFTTGQILLARRTWGWLEAIIA